MNPGPPAVQPIPPFRHRDSRVVRHVIDPTAESVEGCDIAPPLPGQRDKGKSQIGFAPLGDLLRLPHPRGILLNTSSTRGCATSSTTSALSHLKPGAMVAITV